MDSLDNIKTPSAAFLIKKELLTIRFLSDLLACKYNTNNDSIVESSLDRADWVTYQLKNNFYSDHHISFRSFFSEKNRKIKFHLNAEKRANFSDNVTYKF